MRLHVNEESWVYMLIDEIVFTFFPCHFDDLRKILSYIKKAIVSPLLCSSLKHLMNDFKQWKRFFTSRNFLKFYKQCIVL